MRHPRLNHDAEAILCELLVLRCRRGDADAWRDMIGHFERRLLYFVRRLVPDERDAWDVLQQTWMAALRGVSSVLIVGPGEAKGELGKQMKAKKVRGLAVNWRRPTR